MNKKELIEELISDDGSLAPYILNDRGGIDTIIKDVAIEISFSTTVFLGRFKMVSFVYRFKNELTEDYHDEAWDIVDKQIKSMGSDFLQVGAIGYDFIECVILDKSTLSHMGKPFIDIARFNMYTAILELRKVHNV